MINFDSVTVVIPVYNDVQALKDAVPKVIPILSSLTSQYELIIAEDASTDGSAECAADYARNNPNIIHLHRNERLGRGSALTLAASKARGEIFCYFDVDMATDISHLEELLKHIREGFDIATGSRLLPESRIIRSTGREIKSRGYNFLVRLFLRSTLSDHQCGFKALVSLLSACSERNNRYSLVLGYRNSCPCTKEGTKNCRDSCCVDRRSGDNGQIW